MEVSRDQECFEDNKVIVDIPLEEINNESENREVGADNNMVLDHGSSLKNELVAREQHREVENLSHKNLEGENIPSEGTTESEAPGLPGNNIPELTSSLPMQIIRTVSRYNDACAEKLRQFLKTISAREAFELELYDDDLSKLKASPIFQDLLHLIRKYGNVECVHNVFQLLHANGFGPEPVLTNSVQAQYDLKKDYWKLLRDVRLSKKVSDYNTVSASWKELLENDIFKQKTPLGNTLLHIAAENGNEHFVDDVVRRQAPHLLTAKSSNGDTALHVAAKAGNFSALGRLISAHFQNSENLQEALEKILVQNNNGNTFFHEALINDHQGVMQFLVSHIDRNFKEVAKKAAFSITNNEDKSGLYLAIKAGYKHVVDQAFSQVIPNDPKYVPPGKSLLLAAIITKDDDILNTLLTKKPKWIHVRDNQGRVPLHYAASIGYLKGVQSLLAKCGSCVLERDICGYFPIHLASYADHVTVVKELLKSKYCPDPRDILDNDGQNILHVAVQSAKPSVVNYILQASNKHGLEEIINKQDCNGNTPLHLATMFCHPKIVFALTLDKRVDVNLVNRKGETARDALEYIENPSLRQRLTGVALKYARVQHTDSKSSVIKVPPKSTNKFSREEPPRSESLKDNISTLMLVSTLILTVSFAAGFTMPGGTNSSGEVGQGMAVMLHQIWFKLFIFCITISMYGAITVNLILIWAQIGDAKLASPSVDVARSIMGITLVTLSLAFLAAVHLVIRDLSWLATTSLALSFLSIGAMVFLFLLVFWVPSTSRNLSVKYVPYQPFLLLAFLVQYYEDS